MKDVVAALIWENDRFLVGRRPLNKARGGLFEFVGGKTEEGETKEEALIRECKEELDIIVQPLDIYMEVDHIYPDITIHLSLFNCKIVEGTPKLLEHSEIRWILPEEIKPLEFCPADKDLLEKIKLERKK